MKFPSLLNPAWNALQTVQQEFAVDGKTVCRYRQGILPFIGCSDNGVINFSESAQWCHPGDIVYLIGKLPALPDDWKILKVLPCSQMVLETQVPTSDEPDIVLLTEHDRQEIYELIWKVQPGYYELDTRVLGTYIGIRDKGKLVAVAGERMKVEGMSEISAICTLPEYTGRGYGGRLTSWLCHMNQHKNVVPFLHVRIENDRAIRLYERIGFREVRRISFWKVEMGTRY